MATRSNTSIKTSTNMRVSNAVTTPLNFMDYNISFAIAMGNLFSSEFFDESYGTFTMVTQHSELLLNETTGKYYKQVTPTNIPLAKCNTTTPGFSNFGNDSYNLFALSNYYCPILNNITL